jgi:hypothetical protein
MTNSPISWYASVGGVFDGEARRVNVAVPVTVPLGCVGSEEVRVRWRVHDVFDQFEKIFACRFAFAFVFFSGMLGRRGIS